MNYHDKYLKYKIKYLKLKNINILDGGAKNQRFECKPNQDKFTDICVPSANGKYKNQDRCINDCETKFISNQLIKANIKGEALKFQLFIKEIIKDEKIDVYIKGGNVIGLSLLKMIYDKYKNDDKKFKESFNEFLKLELIKDWDFASYTKNAITEEYRDKLDTIAKKYKLEPRAKTFILYQTKKPILLEDKALFEISVLDYDNYSKLELPLTTMKVKVNEYNVKYIFMFAKSFLDYKKGREFDFDILKRMIQKINIIVHPHKNGLYDFNNKNKFDKGPINDDLLDYIKDFAKDDMNVTQFLVTHIIDPFRLFYRLPDKNIPKTDKLKKFIKNELGSKDLPDWLIDTKKISNLIKTFAQKLGTKIKEIYISEIQDNKSILESINKVLEFLNGINFGRLQIEINNGLISKNNMKILSTLVKPLIDEVGKEGITSLQDNDATTKFLKFYANL
jgi:DNA-dependent RNA polymerase auxiliary subunit epsilon